METLNFSYNWNNKLDCKSFTTVRLMNANKYFANAKLKVYLKKDFVSNAVVNEVYKVKFCNFTEFVARIDTGYSLKEFKGVIRKMYSKIPDLENQYFHFVLISKID